jgi:hypothetical protein
VEFGSRLGLLSLPHQVVAAWTDTRNSKQPPGQDVFATTVVFPEGEGGIPGVAGVVLASGALALAGGAFLLLGRRRRGNGDGSREKLQAPGESG